MPDQPPSSLDYTRIDFPTDGLSVAEIRRTEPQLFATDSPSKLHKNWKDSPFSEMLLLERQLAHKAFAKTCGLPDPHGGGWWSRKELIRMLADVYQQFALSSGRKHTEELVKTFEKAASSQARDILGRMEG